MLEREDVRVSLFGLCFCWSVSEKSQEYTEELMRKTQLN